MTPTTAPGSSSCTTAQARFVQDAADFGVHVPFLAAARREGQASPNDSLYARHPEPIAETSSCLRFKAVEDLPLDVVAEAVASVTVKKLVAAHDAEHSR